MTKRKTVRRYATQCRARGVELERVASNSIFWGENMNLAPTIPLTSSGLYSFPLTSMTAFPSFPSLTPNGNSALSFCTLRTEATTLEMRLLSARHSGFVLVGSLRSPPLSPRILKLPPNQPLKIKQRLRRIARRAHFRRISNLPPLRPEPHIARSDPSSYFVGAYFYSTVLPDSYAGVGCAEVDADAGGGEFGGVGGAAAGEEEGGGGGGTFGEPGGDGTMRD